MRAPDSTASTRSLRTTSEPPHIHRTLPPRSSHSARASARIAAAARYEDGARLALAGVAPIPWALDSLDALDAAEPLPGNAYKVELAQALGRRAIASITR